MSGFVSRSGLMESFFVCEPDRHILDGIDHFISDICAVVSFGDRERSREIVRMLEDLCHGHVSAGRTAADQDLFRVDRAVVSDIAVDEFEQAVTEHGCAVAVCFNAFNDFLNYRGKLQHGYGQSDEEAICQGIGPREGMSQNDGVYAILPPTTVYTEEKICRNIDGVEIKMRRAPGETDDQILVYLTEWKVICTGDNYYGVFPNLYAIRGTQYRDIAQWIDSLRLILSYDSEALLPGHTAALTGKKQFRNRSAHSRTRWKRCFSILLTA